MPENYSRESNSQQKAQNKQSQNRQMQNNKNDKHAEPAKPAEMRLKTQVMQKCGRTAVIRRASAFFLPRCHKLFYAE